MPDVIDYEENEENTEPKKLTIAKLIEDLQGYPQDAEAIIMVRMPSDDDEEEDNDEDEDNMIELPIKALVQTNYEEDKSSSVAICCDLAEFIESSDDEDDESIDDGDDEDEDDESIDDGIYRRK